MPTKKTGSEKVVSELVTQKLSSLDPLLLETTIPINIPRRMERAVELPTRSNVLASLPEVTISLRTGSWYSYE